MEVIIEKQDGQRPDIEDPPLRSMEWIPNVVLGQWDIDCQTEQVREAKMKWLMVMLMIGTGLGMTPAAFANDSHIEVAACLFSPADMLRQPKGKPPVLTDSTINCGMHGESSLARLYEQGWHLIQVLPNGAYTNPWIGIFERQQQ